MRFLYAAVTHLPPSIRTFDSVEQLDELPRELGWPLEYRQLEPGSFSSRFTDVEGDTWFLMEECSSRRVEVVAGAPDGMFMLALVEGPEAVINGKKLTRNHILVQTPGSDLRANMPAGTKATQIGISAELAEEIIQTVAPCLEIPHGEVALLGASPGRLESVRRAMRLAILAPSKRQETREELASMILAELLATACDDGEPKKGRNLLCISAQRTLDKAREYIEEHIGETIRVATLCSYSGTTLRSLERIFSRELGVTPQQYVAARRLNAVRRRLLTADREQGLRVTDVAQDHGFSHMGRFAGDYRRYFGESPRETLLGVG